MQWRHLRVNLSEIMALLVASLLCRALFVHLEPESGIENNQNAVSQFNTFLSRWNIGTGVLSVHVLDLMGSLLCCRTYRLNAEGDKHWLESLVSCAVMQFGGTSLTGLALGQPGSWMLGSPSSPLALLLAWWLVFCCPSDLFCRVMSSGGVLWRIPELLGAVSGGHAVSTWGVDKVSESKSERE